jgi:hypothetical protein
MNSNEELDKTVRLIVRLGNVRPPRPLHQASARRAYQDHANQIRLQLDGTQRSGKARLNYMHFRSAASAVGVVCIALGLVTSVVYAADGAHPGDWVYPIDRGAEEFHLMLTSDPELVTSLMLSFAAERLTEAEQLADRGDEPNMAVALNAYIQTISEITKTAGGPGADQQLLGGLIDQALSVHEHRLAAIRARASQTALPGLDRAIESARSVREATHPEAGGPPESTRPDDVPQPQDQQPNGPPADPGPP